MMKIDNQYSPHLDIVPCIDSMVNLIRLMFLYCHNILEHHNSHVQIEYHWIHRYSMIYTHRLLVNMGLIACN